MNITAEERETVCTYDYETKLWTVYTCVPTHLTKLTKINGKPDWFDLSDDGEDRIIAGRWDNLKQSQVGFRQESKGRNLTDEQRKELSERMKKVKQQQK